MEGMVNVEWHGQDYLHLKWHVVCRGLATPALDRYDEDSNTSNTSAYFNVNGIFNKFETCLLKALILYSKSELI